MEHCGVSWEVCANFDQDLATNRTIDQEWEAVLLEKSKTKSSSKDNTDTNKDENEEEEENEMAIEKPTISAGTAVS